MRKENDEEKQETKLGLLSLDKIKKKKKKKKKRETDFLG